MIDWPANVNKDVKRGSNWGSALGVISEDTRCGKPKTRPSNQLEGDSFSVEMLLTKTEYIQFDNWFKQSLRRGTLSFAFPDIVTREVDKEYRIVQPPHYENTSGVLIRCTMGWIEVI